MAYAKELLGLTLDLIVSKHHKPSTCKPIEDLRKDTKKYERALGLLDVVWSSVRGIDGLLPSDEFLTSLEANIEKARVAWLALGLNIDGNPKCHLTFDGHLLEQVRRFEGMADKGEDWIEHLHQCWKKQKELTWHISNFELQQKVQLKNMLVKNNPIIIQGIEETN